MTAIDARPGATGGAAGSGGTPVRPDGVVLLGASHGSGYVVPPALVRRGDGQVLQLTPLLYAVLDAVDGTRDLDQVAAVASRHSGRGLTADDVRTLLDGKLRPLGLVCGPDGSVPTLRKLDPLLRLRPRYVVSDPERTRRLTSPFARLFHPVAVTLVTVAFAVVAFWVLFDKGLASAAYQAFARPGLLLAVFAITVVSAGFHEFGHAAALRRGGGTPGAMGAGLYLIWPAFYTDVTDSYRLDRRARIRTDLGGLYFNAVVAVGMYLLWLGIRWDALLLVIATQVLQMLRQLPPLIRFDGYHLLADVTGVPDLFHRIGPTLRGLVPGRRPTEPSPLKSWVRGVVAAWVVVVVPLLLASTVLAVVTLPRILATTAHSLRIQGHGFSAYVHSGNVPGALAKVLAIVALVVPAGGVVYMLARTSRRYGTAIWRRTAGKPRQRAVAVVAAGAVAAGLAYLWWPHGNYRPIQPYERGTVQDAVPAAAGVLAPTTRLAAGRELSTHTVWPTAAGALPTADHPALAVVLAPRDGEGPTWVFPFDRPGAPGPGDNQAMAVVTKDGGTAYDVAFALVWVDSDTVLDRNEAYAFASCRDCRAVAVSFQVVLVVGHADVVAPQNISAAVSYNCIRCVTEALAVQLVVTLPGPLDDAAMRDLTRLWQQIQAFSHHLRGLTFAQIQARIAAYERQILAIVRPDLTTPPSTTPTPAATSSTGSPSPGATGSATLHPAPSLTTIGTPTSSGGTSAPATATASTTSPAPTGTATTASPTASAGSTADATTVSPSPSPSPSP